MLAKLQASRPTREDVNGGLVRSVYQELWHLRPFRCFLPASLGGDEADAVSVLATLDAAAYEHLPMSLSIALTGALFLLPVAAHAEPGTAAQVLADFDTEEVCLGGMMMTEPDCGTDLFAATTTAEPTRGGFRLRGTKHWSGLTGHSDYWLVFARNDAASRAERLAFYIAGPDLPPGAMRVVEYYDAFGLEPIPYGRTQLDLEVASDRRLGMEDTYTSVVGGTLVASRLTFAGMSHGFLRRVLDDARARTETRRVFGRPLSDFDQVQCRLEHLRFAEIVSRVCCLRVVEAIPTLTSQRCEAGWEATLIKALVTDLMVESADHLAMLGGAEGYRACHGGFAAMIHSHPFRIFEGPNDVLFEQVARERMRAAGTRDLGELLAGSGLDVEAHVLSTLTNDRVVEGPQRDIVLAGRVLALALVLEWAKGLPTPPPAEDLEALALGTRQRIAAALASTSV